MKQTKTMLNEKLKTHLETAIQAIANAIKEAFAKVSTDEHFNWQSEFDGPRSLEQLRSERELSKLMSSGWGRTGSDGI